MTYDSYCKLPFLTVLRLETRNVKRHSFLGSFINRVRVRVHFYFPSNAKNMSLPLICLIFLDLISKIDKVYSLKTHCFIRPQDSFESKQNFPIKYCIFKPTKWAFFRPARRDCRRLMQLKKTTVRRICFKDENPDASPFPYQTVGRLPRSQGKIKCGHAPIFISYFLFSKNSPFFYFKKSRLTSWKMN